MRLLGLDLGTKHIVLAFRDENGKIAHKYEINGYLTIPRADQFTENILKQSAIPYVTRGEEFIAFGSKAEKLAYGFNKTLQRPMAHGGVSMLNEDAQEVIAIIIKSIIGKLKDDATLYFCTTADPINSKNINIDFHRKIVKLIIESYKTDTKKEDGQEIKIAAHHINEARCLIMDQLDGPAIGISWGAGTVTVHAGVMGVQAFEFSIVGSGDWIDIEAAKRFGYEPDNPRKESPETPTTICRRKEKLDLSKLPDDNVDRAIYLMYEILIENVVKQLVIGLQDYKDKFRAADPVPVINAGGTCMPNGFMDIFKRQIDKVKDKLAVPIGTITRAEDPLFAVAHGCLKAAEFHK
jgi:hypothetical protein